MGSKRKHSASDASAPPSKKVQKSKAKPETGDDVVVVDAPPAPVQLFFETPKGPELKKEVRLYEELSSEDATERLRAADAVISGLFGSANTANGVSEATLLRHLERRLCRGLASGRKGARIGFSVVFSEILGTLFRDTEKTKRYPGLTFERVLGILNAKTKPEGDLSGQEERDHALGLLFGLQCFVRANFLFQQNDEQAGRWETILGALLALAKKKPWMREECGWVIVEALSQMLQTQAEATLENMEEAQLASSPEGVGVWLAARRLFPDMRIPTKTWGTSGNPLAQLKKLAKALKESGSGADEGQAKQTGNWNAKLHFVWDLVMGQFVEDVKSGKDDVEGEFENFWKVAVDENLFAGSASSERKFWGFLIFQKMLQDTASYKGLLASLFSHNLVRCLINHLSKQDRFLHRAADKSIKVLLQVAEATPNTAATMISGLISGHGVYNFDQVTKTKTKTIDKLLSIVDGEGAEEVVQSLLAPILVLDSKEDAESRRRCFSDYLLSMIRHNSIADQSKDITWVKTTALPILASLAYCKKKLVCKPALSDESRSMFQTRLMSAVAHLISDQKGFSYPCELLKSFKPDAIDMDDEITAAKDKALSIMEKLIKKSKKASEQESKPLNALALLYSIVIFQLYSGESDAVSVLEELKVCYDKLIRGKDTDSTDDVSQILVEILLSFLSKSSALLRKVAEQVFTAFSGEITAEGLKLMTDVLESSESLRGQQELFDQEDNNQGAEDESGSESESGNDEDELDSDVEMVDLREVNDEPESDDEDDEDGTDHDGDDVASDSEEALKLDAALAAALGTHRLDEDLRAESSDSDADMSDSEMMALDAKLVEIFSQRKAQPNKKKEKKDAKASVVNFKNRVLDLFEIYVKKQASNPLAFDLVVPLLRLMRETSTKQVGEKSFAVIAAFAKATKAEKENVTMEVSEGVELLKEIHAEATKGQSHAFARAASMASLMVVAVLWKKDRTSLRVVAEAYTDVQVAWVGGEVKMQASFFHDWINWCQSHVVAV